jgi:hypothetical protein
MPLGAPITVTDPATGNAITIPNPLVNFGWEYVWHCHLLGHEENDMMRAVEFNVSPAPPTSLTATASVGPQVTLAWTNNWTLPSATNVLVQRSTSATFSTSVATMSVPATATSYVDTAVSAGVHYYYRIRTENTNSFSTWSGLAQATTYSVSRYEQTDPRLTWSGPWTTTFSSSLSGGSYAWGTTTATVLARFDGTAISLIGTKSRYGGIGAISVDGAAATLVDFYASTIRHQQVVWSVTGLTPGVHTVAVSGTVLRNSASLGGNIYVDAFDVTGVLLQAATRFQQTDARVGFTGPWITTSSLSLSGGSYVGGTASGVMTLRFDGTAMDLIGTLSPFGGISTISVDGGTPLDIDFYASATSHQRKVWGTSGLSAGPHSVRLVVTSRRNPASSGGNAYVDAFDVMGALLAARFEQTDPLISYGGSWFTVSSPSLSGGSYARGVPGATMTLAFDGTSIDLVGTLSPYGGISTISVDGGAPTDANFYGGPLTLHKQRVWGVLGLGAGRHTLTLTVTNRRSPASLGNDAYVDAFDACGALVP